MSDNLNSGHRLRLKKRFLQSGYTSMCEHEILELLLCYAIPRKDVKPLAKQLLWRFGSLQAVLNATENQLMQSSGLGENSVALLKLVKNITQDIMPDAPKTGEILKNSSQLKNFLIRNSRFFTGEVMMILLLDNEFRLLDKVLIKGYKEALSLNYGELSCKIFSCPKVRQVIMAHKHPGNNPRPSRSDINSTIELKLLLSKCGISLLDHFIITDEQCVSMMKHP